MWYTRKSLLTKQVAMQETELYENEALKGFYHHPIWKIYLYFSFVYIVNKRDTVQAIIWALYDASLLSVV